jgi:hypothetical protein
VFQAWTLTSSRAKYSTEHRFLGSVKPVPLWHREHCPVLEADGLRTGKGQDLERTEEPVTQRAVKVEYAIAQRFTLAGHPWVLWTQAPA